jgi:hypothetical protein
MAGDDGDSDGDAAVHEDAAMHEEESDEPGTAKAGTRQGRAQRQTATREAAIAVEIGFVLKIFQGNHSFFCCVVRNVTANDVAVTATVEWDDGDSKAPADITLYSAAVDTNNTAVVVWEVDNERSWVQRTAKLP